MAMTKRSDMHALTEQHKGIEAAALEALKHAANAGWADVSAGRYTDVGENRLEAFIGQLGQTASAIYGSRCGTRKID